MVFTSFIFLLFFPALILVYYLSPLKYRWLILLIASYLFYINIKPVYALLVAGVSLSTYFFTRLIFKSNNEKKRKIYFLSNIVLILFPLFFYKYFGEINSGIIALLSQSGLHWPLPEIKLLLPVGISFYTFLAVGYTIDVYNEDIEPENNLGILALFVSFFPLILSGPIERAKNMLPQFRIPQVLKKENLAAGFKLMLWGYFMKLVVADRLGLYIDAVYGNIDHHNGTSFLFASVLFPFQVYADLGGYSLIAIGSAKILGFNVIDNFKRPFFATTISEFWRRWHMSLISWLTDYVYTPLNFSFRKFKIWGVVIALLVTFVLSGIWHGAAMTFVLWGLIQGVFLSIEALTSRSRVKLEKKYGLTKRIWYLIIGMGFTFSVFMLSQIFGKAHSVSEAITIYGKIFTQPGDLFIGTRSTFLHIILGLGILMLKDFMDEFYPGKIKIFEHRSKTVRLFSYASITLFIILFGVLSGNQFIYFQF